MLGSSRCGVPFTPSPERNGGLFLDTITSVGFNGSNRCSYLSFIFQVCNFAVNVSIVPYDNAMVTSDIILIIVLTELTSELEVSILTTAHISSLKL